LNEKGFHLSGVGLAAARRVLRQIGVAVRGLAGVDRGGRRQGEAPEEYVRRLATTKADKTWDDVESDDLEPRPVLAADTAVVLDGRVLGKPATPTRPRPCWPSCPAERIGCSRR